MYIALLFSGHKRSFLRHVDLWKRMIGDLEAEGATVNCFFHSWTVDCQVAQNGGRRIEGFYVKIPLLDTELMINAFPFKRYALENEEDIEPLLTLPRRVLLLDKQAAKKHIAMQLYSMQRSYEMMIQWEKENGLQHSTIVKLRFDTFPQSWNLREFFLSQDSRFANLLIAANEKVHPHPGGGGGCLLCHNEHRRWWEQHWTGRDIRPEPSDLLWQHNGPHGNDICDFYAIGNRTTMGQYMTLYSRILELYPDTFFNDGLRYWHEKKRKKSFPCPIDDQDVRVPAHNMEMEDAQLACFYPERLQRFNLKDFSVLPAASMFYRD